MSTALVNATPVEVVYLDPKVPRETLLLPRLTIEQLDIWAKLVRDKSTPELVKLCTGRDGAWLNSLSDESFAELGGKCVELNFRRAMTIGRRDPVMASLLGPLLTDAVATMSQAASGNGGTSSDLSREPSPSVSPAVNGTASSNSLPNGSAPSSASASDSAPRIATSI